MDLSKDCDISQLSFVVVDDNRNFLNIMRTVLRPFGSRSMFETTTAYGALEYMRSHDADFLFTDLMMPEMDGFELISLIRNDKTLSCRGLPIICISAYAEKDKIVQAIKTGSDGFLAKPVSPDRIYRQILSHVENPLPRVSFGGYFGPDRRRGMTNNRAGEDRRSQEAIHI